MRADTIIKGIIKDARNQIEAMTGTRVMINYAIPETGHVSDTLNVDSLIFFVAKHTGISALEIKGKKRLRPFTEARHLLFYIAYKVYNVSSLSNIGLHVGGRDHSTVIHGIGVMEDLLLYDKKLKATLKAVVQDADMFLNIRKCYLFNRELTFSGSNYRSFNLN